MNQNTVVRNNLKELLQANINIQKQIILKSEQLAKTKTTKID